MRSGLLLSTVGLFGWALLLAGASGSRADGTQFLAACMNAEQAAPPGEAHAMAVDATGNTYVLGSIPGAPGTRLVKWNTTLGKDWDRLIPFLTTQPAAIAVAPDASTYVFGSTGAVGAENFMLVKYAHDGSPLWGWTVDGGDRDTGHAVAVDSISGNVYVTGLSKFGPTDYRYLTIKYSPDGTEAWRVNFARQDAVPAAIAVDGARNRVYVTGSAFAQSGAPTLDYWTIAYNEDTGSQEWATHFDGTVGNDQPTAMAVDGEGNIIVTGHSLRDAGSNQSDFATIKYLYNGSVSWVRRHVQGNSGAAAVAVDENNDVYVTGTASFPGFNYLTIKYSRDSGDAGWPGLPGGAARYAGPTGGTDVAVSLAVSDSKVYVTGYSSGDGTANDWATLAYHAGTGALAWTALPNGAARMTDSYPGLAADDRPVGVRVAPGGIVVVAGTRRDVGGPRLGVVRYGTQGSEATSRCRITRSGFRYNNRTSRYVQTITVLNTSGTPIPGPISFAMQNVPAGIVPLPLPNCEILPDRAPYRHVSTGGIGTNASLTFTVEFAQAGSTVPISYTPRIYSGLIP